VRPNERDFEAMGLRLVRGGRTSLTFDASPLHEALTDFRGAVDGYLEVRWWRPVRLALAVWRLRVAWRAIPPKARSVMQLHPRWFFGR